ncbi:hypothetical protein B0T10DRAFT_490526 [Thelonectria olida]|uniref:Zn(2)-C6 fungal-type domain-containing protein n=1 Tax=Thelonectria olida TaxID=1576542 RepID=A0A9P9ANQ2_9HYPO|nr:hypothetical protein B0T10DRAFT_490526 [Thelonectria olida]
MDPFAPMRSSAETPATDNRFGDLVLAPAPPQALVLGSSNSAPSSSAFVNASEFRMPPPPVPAACLACRGKHLKCDGKRPCSRCITSSYDCVYVASRRGYRGQQAQNKVVKNVNKPTKGPSSSVGNSIAATTAFNFATPVFSDLGPPPPFSRHTATDFSNVGFHSPFGTPLHTLNVTFDQPVPRTLPYRDGCIDSFYHHFHAAHPFVLPKSFLLLLANDDTLEPLLAAIRWVGSLFIDDKSISDDLLKEAYRLIYKPGVNKGGFLVQAMLLLIIGLDGHRRRKRVDSLLNEARKISIQIGLHARFFAMVNGQGIPVLEESWRRTWWELYVTDALIAGVHRASKFHLYDVPADVALPCEEHQYLSSHIPAPLHLEDLDHSNLLDGGREFSSFAYRVQCCRIMGKMLTVSPSGPGDKSLAQIDSLLTNWRLYLPLSKQNAYDNHGQLDEMMFQAHMMLHAISILLHQPHSQLDPSPTYYINACAPNTPAISSDALNAHTILTIQSANEISKLVTHRVSLLSHTHFFAYMLTLSSTIHLSKWSLTFVPQNDDSLRQNIRLNIGALVKYSEMWPAAQHLTKQVKTIAQDVYQMKTGQQLLHPKSIGMAGH